MDANQTQTLTPHAPISDPLRPLSGHERYEQTLAELKRDGALNIAIPKLARHAGWSVSYAWKLVAEGRIGVTRFGRKTLVSVFEAARTIAYGEGQ
jgi:hypothetical protein